MTASRVPDVPGGIATRWALLVLVACAGSCGVAQTEPDVLDVVRAHPELARRVTAKGIVASSTGFVAATRAPRPRFAVTLPTSTGGSLHLASDDATWLDIRAIDTADAPLHWVDGALIARRAARDTDVVFAHDDRGVEELRVLRSREAKTTFHYDVATGPAIRAVDVVDGRIVARTAAGPAFVTEIVVAEDGRGTRRALGVEVAPSRAGHRLTLTLDTNGLVFPIVVDPAWTATGDLIGARADAVAVTLATGKVLVAGGTDGTTWLKTTEIYDPTTATWSAGPLMNEARARMFAVRIEDGRVLMGGGLKSSTTASSTLDLYAPATNTIVAGPTMSVGRNGPCVSPIPPVGVVIYGGSTGTDGTSASQTYEVWMSSTSAFMGAAQSAPAILGARAFAAAAVLPSGNLLVAGGESGPTSLSTAAVYDRATNVWTLTSMAMPSPRSHASVARTGQSVLLAGGAMARRRCRRRSVSTRARGASYPRRRCRSRATTSRSLRCRATSPRRAGCLSKRGRRRRCTTRRRTRGRRCRT